MIEFLFTAECRFLAEDLDDAFKNLEEHFRGLREGTDGEFEFVGNIHIEPSDKGEEKEV